MYVCVIFYGKAELAHCNVVRSASIPFLHQPSVVIKAAVRQAVQPVAVDVALVAVAEGRKAHVEARRVAHDGAALPKAAVAGLVQRAVEPARADGVHVRLHEEHVAVAALVKGDGGLELVVAAGGDDQVVHEVHGVAVGGLRGGEVGKVDRHVRKAAAQHGRQPRRGQHGAQLLDGARGGGVGRRAVEEEGQVRNWGARVARRQRRRRPALQRVVHAHQLRRDERHHHHERQQRGAVGLGAIVRERGVGGGRAVQHPREPPQRVGVHVDEDPHEQEHDGEGGAAAAAKVQHGEEELEEGRQARLCVERRLGVGAAEGGELEDARGAHHGGRGGGGGGGGGVGVGGKGKGGGKEGKGRGDGKVAAARARGRW
ncbi:hypothetical protein FGB62_25g640 [Gracilaria domingensis]|nr:hypothetical protein FGB62_25g640 [Gracilaria domingensis]